MTTAYQLPEDIGQKSVTKNGVEVQQAGTFPGGQTSSANSMPVVLPRGGFTLPIIDNYRFVTEVDRDQLGFPRISAQYTFQALHDQFELSEDDWIYDVTGLNERPENDTTQSARWTQLLGASAVYSPLPNGEILHNIKSGSAQLILNSNNGAFQRARIASKKRYRYQPGRIARVSLAVRLSTIETPVSVTRLWGVGDTTDGFFIECRGDGNGDRLGILYRNSAGNGLKFETRVPRSQWTGDKLDGTGSSNQTLDLSKVHMWTVEWGWYGASNVRFYAYVVDKSDELPTSITQIPRARWILVHELMIADTAIRNDLVEDDGGGSTRSYDVPSLRTPSLPVWVEINNSGNIARSEYIERYGAAVFIDGGTDDRANIRAVDGAFGTSAEPVIGGNFSNAGVAAMTLSARTKILNSDNKLVDNFLVTCPLQLSVESSDLVELEIYKDPEMVDPLEVGHINGSLAYRKGQYLGPNNVIPIYIGSSAPSQADPAILEPIAITQEDPLNYFLTVTSPYTSTEPQTVDINFSNFRLIKSGRPVVSLLCPAGGTTFDLTEVFGAQRENVTAEYDAPPEFPVNTDLVTVRSFDTSTGLITVDSAFPLRLYLNQRIAKGATNYFVRTIVSSTSFTIKAAKVDTAPVLSGIAENDSLVAFYELDLSANIASPLKSVYRSELVFVIKPFNHSFTKLDKTQQYDAEWMSLVSATSSNSYTAVASPTVNLYLTSGVA
jgi:hypothetical protein